MAGTATTLSGTGFISGTVGGGGTVAPGNSIGTLTVGSYLGQSTALVIETAADGRSDRLAVAGAANLAGGTLQVVPVRGFGGIYTALTAGAVQGSFDAVTTGTRTGAGARYTPVAVEVATANPFQTDAAARTGAADTLRSLDLFERRANAFRIGGAFGPPAGAGAVGTPASPEAGGTESLKGWLSQRGPLAAGSRAMGAAVWASAYGNLSRLEADGPVPAIASSGGGVMVGADAEIAPHLLAGVMGAFSRSTAQASPGGYASRLDADAYTIAAYGAVEVGPAVISASGLAGRGDLATLRPTTFAGMAGFARGRLDDTRFAGRLSALTTLQAGDGPAGAQGGGHAAGGRAESLYRAGLPAAYASTIGRTRFALARPELSLALGRTVPVSLGGWSGLLDAEIRAGIGRDLVLQAPDALVRIPGFTPLAVRGFDRDAFVVPVGARAELTVRGRALGLRRLRGRVLAVRHRHHRARGPAVAVLSAAAPSGGVTGPAGERREAVIDRIAKTLRRVAQEEVAALDRGAVEAGGGRAGPAGDVRRCHQGVPGSREGGDRAGEPRAVRVGRRPGQGEIRPQGRLEQGAEFRVVEDRRGRALVAGEPLPELPGGQGVERRAAAGQVRGAMGRDHHEPGGGRPARASARVRQKAIRAPTE